MAVCLRLLDGVLGLRLGAVTTLRQHKQSVRRVVIVGIEGSCRCLGLRLDHRAVPHLLRLRGDRALVLGLLLALGGSSAHGSAMEIESARRAASAGELSKDGLRVGARGREHRPATAGRQTCPQRRLVWCESAAQMMCVAKVVIGRARQHGRAEGTCPQRPAAQLKDVTPLPGSSDDGDVSAATDGSFVPLGVSGAPPKDCSKGLGSRLKEPPAWLLK